MLSIKCDTWSTENLRCNFVYKSLKFVFLSVNLNILFNIMDKINLESH